MTIRSERVPRFSKGSPTSINIAQNACARTTELPVRLSVDGQHYVVGLELDPAEHRRRHENRLGAIPSTGLLHALWELPLGVAIPWHALKPIDRSTLHEEGKGWVEHTGDTVVRTYRPAGAIRSVLVSHDSLSTAVNRAGSHPPTVRRIALWAHESSHVSAHQEASLARARALGVGVWAGLGERISQLVEPAQPMLGRPVVFRWWQAELAYRNWLSNTGPTGTAAPSG